MGLPSLQTGDGGGSNTPGNTNSRPATTSSSAWPTGHAFQGMSRLQEGGRMQTSDTIRTKLGMYGSFKPGTPAPLLGSRVMGSSGYIAYSSVDLLPALPHGTPRDSGVLPLGWGLSEEDKQKLKEHEERNDAHHKEWLRKTGSFISPHMRAQRRREHDIQTAIDMVRTQQAVANDAYQTWAVRKMEQEAVRYGRQLRAFQHRVSLVRGFREEDKQYQTFAASREGHFELRTGPAVMPHTFSDFNKPPPATAPAGASRAHTFLRRRTAPNTAQGVRPGIKPRRTQKSQPPAAGLQEDAPVADGPLEQEVAAEGADAVTPDMKPITLPPIGPLHAGSSSGTVPLLSPRTSGSTGAAAAGGPVSTSGSACIPTSARPGTSSSSRGSRTPSATSRLGAESGAGLISPRASGTPPYVTPGSIHVPSKVPLVPVPNPISLRGRPSSSTGNSPVQGAPAANVALPSPAISSPRPEDGALPRSSGTGSVDHVAAPGAPAPVAAGSAGPSPRSSKADTVTAPQPDSPEETALQRSSGAGSVGRIILGAPAAPAAAGSAVPSPRSSRGSSQRQVAASPQPTSSRPGSGASGRASHAAQAQAAAKASEPAAAGQEAVLPGEGSDEQHSSATAVAPGAAEDQIQEPMVTDRASGGAPAVDVSGEQERTSSDQPAASGDEPRASVDQPAAAAPAPAAPTEDAADRLSGGSSHAAEQEPSLQSLVQPDHVPAATDGAEARDGAEGALAVQAEGSSEAAGYEVVREGGLPLGAEVGAEPKAEVAEDVAAAGPSAADLVEVPVAAEGSEERERSSGEQAAGPVVQQEAGLEADMTVDVGTDVGAGCLAAAEPGEEPAATAAEAAEAETAAVVVPAAAQGAEEQGLVAHEQGPEEPASPVMTHEAEEAHEAVEQVAERDQGDGEVVQRGAQEPADPVVAREASTQEAAGQVAQTDQGDDGEVVEQEEGVRGGVQAQAQDMMMLQDGAQDGAQAVRGSQPGAGPGAEPEAGLQQDVVHQDLVEQLGLGVESPGQGEVDDQEEVGEGVWEGGAEAEVAVGPVVGADGEQLAGPGLVGTVDEAGTGTEQADAADGAVSASDEQPAADAHEEPSDNGENDAMVPSAHGDA